MTSSALSFPVKEKCPQTTVYIFKKNVFLLLTTTSAWMQHKWLLKTDLDKIWSVQANPLLEWNQNTPNKWHWTLRFMGNSINWWNIFESSSCWAINVVSGRLLILPIIMASHLAVLLTVITLLKPINDGFQLIPFAKKYFFTEKAFQSSALRETYCASLFKNTHTYTLHGFRHIFIQKGWTIVIPHACRGRIL